LKNYIIILPYAIINEDKPIYNSIDNNEK